MSVAVKICGLSDEASVQAAVAAGAAYAGFVHFSRSPRHVSLTRAAELRQSLRIPAVMVLVDPDDTLLADIADQVKPDYVQLHGQETPQRVDDIKRAYPAIKIIKAISVRTGDDIAAAKRYTGADMLLFDAKPPELPGMLPGGNALSFDWALLAGREFAQPWILSGGLTPENVAHAIAQTGAKIVDVSSGVESAPGVKDASLIRAFIESTRA